MKHSITIKFLAFILCALSLVTIIFSGFGIERFGLFKGLAAGKSKNKAENN